MKEKISYISNNTNLKDYPILIDLADKAALADVPTNDSLEITEAVKSLGDRNLKYFLNPTKENFELASHINDLFSEIPENGDLFQLTPERRNYIAATLLKLEALDSDGLIVGIPKESLDSIHDYAMTDDFRKSPHASSFASWYDGLRDAQDTSAEPDDPNLICGIDLMEDDFAELPYATQADIIIQLEKNRILGKKPNLDSMSYGMSFMLSMDRGLEDPEHNSETIGSFCLGKDSARVRSFHAWESGVRASQVSRGNIPSDILSEQIPERYGLSFVPDFSSITSNPLFTEERFFGDDEKGCATYCVPRDEKGRIIENEYEDREVIEYMIQLIGDDTIQQYKDGYPEPGDYNKENLEGTLIAYAEAIAHCWGFTQVPKIDLCDAPENDKALGRYSAYSDVIHVYFNPDDTFDTLYDYFNTIAHEMWHAWQYRMAISQEKYPRIAKVYEYSNTSYYIEAEDDYDGYRAQRLEAEAFLMGDLMEERLEKFFETE